MLESAWRFWRNDQGGRVCGVSDAAENNAGLPRVSVVMPMRNAEAFVETSVRSVVEQQGVDVELIVVDDGSTDASVAVVDAVGSGAVRVIPGPQSGIAAALNAGIAACTGDYFARCDSDDLFPPGRLQEHVSFLETHREFDAVCGSFFTVDPRGTLVSDLGTGAEAKEITEELKDGETRTHFGTFLVRMSMIRKLNGARDYFIGTEDVDLQLRIGTAGRVWYLPSNAYEYRLHHASSTHTQPSPQREFLTEQARKFAKQRVETGTDDLEQGVAQAPPTHHAKAMSVGGQIQGMLVGRSWKEVAAGRWGAALKTGWSAALARPVAARGWVNLLKLFVLPALRGRGAAGEGA